MADDATLQTAIANLMYCNRYENVERRMTNPELADTILDLVRDYLTRDTTVRVANAMLPDHSQNTSAFHVITAALDAVTKERKS